MKKLLLIAGLAICLAFPVASQAHNGKHWTPREAARHLVNDGFQFSSGLSYPYSATCYGFGHNFYKANGQRVFSKFTCATYWDNGCFNYEIWVRRGYNWVWFDERAVNNCR